MVKCNDDGVGYIVPLAVDAAARKSAVGLARVAGFAAFVASLTVHRKDHVRHGSLPIKKWLWSFACREASRCTRAATVAIAAAAAAGSCSFINVTIRCHVRLDCLPCLAVFTEGVGADHTGCLHDRHASNDVINSERRSVY